MSEYFPKSPTSYGESIKIKVDLSNYATKANIKNITHIDTSGLALKTNLANLTNEVDKLDIDKLVPVPADLSKLSDVVKNYVVKKTVYNKLFAKVNNIDTSGFILKTKYDADKLELEKKIPDTSNLVKKTVKVTEIDNKILDISSLATKTALTALENKIPSASNLVKKTDYNAEITETEKKITDHNHDKFIDTPEFNKLATNFFNARLAQANLIPKIDFEDRLLGLNKKITSNKTNYLLIGKQLSYLQGRSYFDKEGTQNYFSH